MIHIDPASPDFVVLPRDEQARIYRHHLGWKISALMDEFGVCKKTVVRWTTPGAKERERVSKSAYLKSERGRARRREQVRNYRARLKAKDLQGAA